MMTPGFCLESFQTIVQGGRTQLDPRVLTKMRRQISAFREAKEMKIFKAQYKKGGIYKELQKSAQSCLEYLMNANFHIPMQKLYEIKQENNFQKNNNYKYTKQIIPRAHTKQSINPSINLQTIKNIKNKIKQNSD